MDIGTIEECQGIVGCDVKNLGIVKNGFIHIAQGKQQVSPCLKDGNILRSNSQCHIITIDGLTIITFRQLHLGDIGIGKGIANIIRRQSERLTKLFYRLVILLLMRRSKPLLDVGLVRLGRRNQK